MHSGYIFVGRSLTFAFLYQHGNLPDLIRMIYLSYSKQGPDHLFSLAYPLAGQTAGGDGEEGGLALACDTLANQCLACAWRSKQQQALWWTS